MPPPASLSLGVLHASSAAACSKYLTVRSAFALARTTGLSVGPRVAQERPAVQRLEQLIAQKPAGMIAIRMPSPAQCVCFQNHVVNVIARQTMARMASTRRGSLALCNEMSSISLADLPLDEYQRYAYAYGRARRPHRVLPPLMK